MLSDRKTHTHTHTSLSVLFKVVNYFSFRIYSAIQCKEFRVAATGTRRFTIVTTGAPYSSLDWHFNRISVSYNGTQLVARSVYMCVWSVCIELRYSPHLFRSIIILLYFVVGFFCFNDGSCRRKIKVKHFSGTVWNFVRVILSQHEKLNNNKSNNSRGLKPLC